MDPTMRGVADREWIRIRGANASNPVLLLIQQGPGLPMINEVRRFEHLLGLEQDFTVIYWDQRGCGRSLRGSALRRSALRAARRDTAVTVESAWWSAFAVRVDGSRRSAACARRCTSARVSGTAIASSSHIRRRLEKNAHMLRVPSSSSFARCYGATGLVPG
jgi:hypothetical protein